MKPLLFGILTITLFFAMTSASGAPKKPAPSAKNLLPPVGTYGDYAFSKNFSSYDHNNPKYAEIGVMPASIKKCGADYVVLAGGSSQTLFHAPLGWYSGEDGQNSTLFSPDMRTRFIMGFRDMGEKTTFDQFKKQALAEVRAQMKSLKQPAAVVSGFDLPDGSYAVEATGVITSSGAKNGFLQVFTPNTTTDPERSRYLMSLSLTAPLKTFAKYRGLTGLILRDRVIIW